MAITNYSELKNAVQNWIGRTDSDFINRVDEFIDLTEDRIHYGFGEPGDQYYSAPLRIRGMETTGTLTINGQTIAVPTGFLEERRIYLNTDPKNDLVYLPPDRFWASTAGSRSAGGKPVMYTIEGSNFIFAPSPDATYSGKVLYAKKMDALSNSTPTNWLITNAPSVYLYGALHEAMIWDYNDEGALKYINLYNGKINALARQDRLSKTGGGSLSQRPDKVA